VIVTDNLRNLVSICNLRLARFLKDTDVVSGVRAEMHNVWCFHRPDILV
jgi:hypothetical protein